MRRAPRTHRRAAQVAPRRGGLILLNKPYGVLCQFRPSGERPTLATLVDVPAVYPAGRLDADSEGLVLLTGDGNLQHRITDPRHHLEKVYWVQVERVPDEAALARLRTGIELDGRLTLPAGARRIDEPPGLWPRDPPVRFRLNVPTCWLEIRLHEGRNRQVRRMTAAVGHPTLRLVRHAIGPWTIDGLEPGRWRRVARPEIPPSG